jgi:hypothetical protein
MGRKTQAQEITDTGVMVSGILTSRRAGTT